MTALWTATELAAATGGKTTRDFAVTGAAIDSRSTAAGDLFVALHGPNHDAHDFVADALARGAAAAMVDHVPKGVAAGAPLLHVGDTLEALTALGRAARERSKATIIGITGSVGKTGTKEALRLALGAQGVTYASAASFNNHWGVPLSLARMPRDTRYGIFEMGMNHAGELTFLAGIARPHIAIITSIAPAHLGFFASVEAIADAKAEIFTGIEPGGSAILNRDNEQFARLEAAARRAGIARIVGFGATEAAEARLLEAKLEETRSLVTATILGERVEYVLPTPGQHWVMNSLAVLAAVKFAGADLAAGAAALAQLPGLPGRGLRQELPSGVTLIDESYNANPASMRAAIAVLGGSTPRVGGRRIAVLGEMRELGDEASRLHAELAEPLKAAKIDLVFTVGPVMAALRDALPPAMRGGHAASSQEMAPIVATALRSGDIVTVKGSLSMAMATIVKHLLGTAKG